MMKNGNNICKLKLYMNDKLHHMSNSVDGTAVKLLASKFLVVIEIVTKHCRKLLFRGTRYLNLCWLINQP